MSEASGLIGRVRKTSLRTFRFQADLLASMESEAEAQGMTLNALVASILTNHVEWDAKAKKFGFIPVYGPIFRALLDKSEEKTLEHIGRKILPDMWKEMTEFWFHESSPEKILDLMTFRSRHLPYVQTELTREGKEYLIVYRHDLGHEWSLVVRSAMDELARNLFKVQPTVDVGDTVVTARFSTP